MSDESENGPMDLVVKCLKNNLHRFDSRLEKIPSRVMDRAIGSFAKHFGIDVMALLRGVSRGLKKTQRLHKSLDDPKKAYNGIQGLLLEALGNVGGWLEPWFAELKREINTLAALTVFCELKVKDYQHLKIADMDVALLVKVGVLHDYCGVLKLPWNLVMGVDLDSFMESLAQWFPGFHLDMTGKKWFRLLYHFIGADKGKKDDFDKVC